MQNGFVSWIVFSTAFEPLHLSVVRALLSSVDSEIWLQAGNYQIRSQPKIKILISLLCMCADRHSDRDGMCLYSIKDDLQFEELNCEFSGF